MSITWLKTLKNIYVLIELENFFKNRFKFINAFFFKLKMIAMVFLIFSINKYGNMHTHTKKCPVFQRKLNEKKNVFPLFKFSFRIIFFIETAFDIFTANVSNENVIVLKRGKYVKSYEIKFTFPCKCSFFPSSSFSSYEVATK